MSEEWLRQTGENPEEPEMPAEDSRRTAGDPVEPDVDVLESELARERYRSRFRGALQSTIFALITVAAVAVLVATLWMPVLQIYGSGMNPTLSAGDVVVCRKTEKFSRGDVIAFYFNNKILVKRVIAVAGDEVNIDKNGVVSVNGEVQQETYVTRLALGDATNIEMPYTVPQHRVFVMGDDRENVVDSRNSGVGCVDCEQVVGKLLLRIWPGRAIGRVK